jgi:hypothetical protein
MTSVKNKGRTHFPCGLVFPPNLPKRGSLRQVETPDVTVKAKMDVMVFWKSEKEEEEVVAVLPEITFAMPKLY